MLSQIVVGAGLPLFVLNSSFPANLQFAMGRGEKMCCFIDNLMLILP
jgi:hypothetical protein